ncbi:hypothetical protein VCV18_006693 [Metarhizium anisopliae]
MLLFFILALLRAVSVFASSGDIVLVCTKDALYSSLYQNGRQFCSSVLGKPPCEVVTPTAYATYDPAVISSRLCVDGQMSSTPDGQLLNDNPSGQLDCVFYIELTS